MPTQHGSKIYDGHFLENDAPCVAVLRSLGALILGKTVNQALFDNARAFLTLAVFSTPPSSPPSMWVAKPPTRSIKPVLQVDPLQVRLQL